MPYRIIETRDITNPDSIKNGEEEMKKRYLTFIILLGVLSLLITQCAPIAPTANPVPNPTSPSNPNPTITSNPPSPSNPTATTVSVSQEPVKLTMTVASEDESPVFTQLANEFHKTHPNITIEILTTPATNYGEYFDKIAIMIAGGSNIDLMRLATENAQLANTMGIAQPIDEFLNKDPVFKNEFFSDVDEKLFIPFQYKGELYGLPFEWNTCAIFYNTKIFQQAGVNPPKPDWTVDDFLATAQKVTKVTNGVTEIWGYQDSYTTFSSETWFFNSGGGILNSDWTKSNVTDPKTVEALQWMHDLVWKYKVSPTGTEVGWGGSQPMFIAGKIAMIATGRWNVMTYVNAGFKDWDVVPFPKWRQQTNVYGVGSTYMLKSSKNKDAAWEFLKYLGSKEAISLVAKQGWGIPARRSVAYDKDVMGVLPPANYRFWYDVLKDARSTTAPFNYNKVADIYSRYLGLVVHNEMPVDQAVQKMDAELNAAFSQ